MPCVASKTKQYPIRNSGLHTEIQRPSAGLAHTLITPTFIRPGAPCPPFSSEPSLSKLHPLIGAHRVLASEMIACQVRPGLRPRRHHATPSLSADPPCFLVVWRPSHADAGRRTSHLLPAFAFARWPLKHRSASAPSEFCLQTPPRFPQRSHALASLSAQRHVLSLLPLQRFLRLRRELPADIAGGAHAPGRAAPIGAIAGPERASSGGRAATAQRHAAHLRFVAGCLGARFG